jgi:nucleotide-binding universal stress UspA family protein
MDATVEIVSVVPPTHYGTDIDEHELCNPLRLAVERRIHAQLEEFQARAPSGMLVKASVLDGDPATLLLDAAASSDLLVLGSRSYSPLDRALLGTVSAEMVHSSPVPVLVFPHCAEPCGEAAATEGRAGTGT